MPDEPAPPGMAHVVEDEPVVRESLALLLGAAGIEARCYESGEAFLHAAERTPPHGCVLLDIRMPGMDGLAVLRSLGARGLRLPVIMVTAHGDVQLAVEAMKAGACDFIEKPYEGEAMLRAVQAALAREEAEAAHSREVAAAAARLALLTRREREVLEGLVAGRQNKVIALDLGLSPRTVEVHRAHVMAKLRAGSLPEVVRIALAAGFRPTR
jgi:two-component system response regulator FixJ